MNAHARLPEGMIPCIADDGTLFPAEKMEAHRRAYFHQAVSVFIFDAEGRLLIQQRAEDKYHCGGQWANTCCSHPHWGESHVVCAERRLREELGFSVPLQPCSVVEYSADVGQGLWEHERVEVFKAVIDPAEVAVVPNPAEVMAWRFVSIADLRQEMRDGPATFTPWFRIYLERWADMKLD